MWHACHLWMCPSSRLQQMLAVKSCNNHCFWKYMLEVQYLHIVLLKSSPSLCASHRTTPAYMSSQKTQFGILVKGVNLSSEATPVPFGPSCTRWPSSHTLLWINYPAPSLPIAHCPTAAERLWKFQLISCRTSSHVSHAGSISQQWRQIWRDT